MFKPRIVRMLFLYFVLISGECFAQPDTASVSQQDVKYGFLPILSFNTDDGFLLGAEVQQYNYSGVKPFLSHSILTFYYNTFGAYTLQFYRDQVRTFGTDIRSNFDLFTIQDFDNYYFGKTDEIGFDRQRFDTTSYYFFKSYALNIGVSTRFPLKIEGDISRTDIKTGLRIVYETPWDNPSGRFINERQIPGHKGDFLTLVEVAFIEEKRDSEFRPTKGFQFEVGSKYALPLVSTKHPLKNYLNVVGFLPVFREAPVTLAGRFNFQNTIGDTPYWFRPALGGKEMLRGYIYRRFSSDNSISYNLELRTWLVKISFKNIELGLNFFMDGGRVFSNSDWSRILQNHKHTLGLGGVMSIFTPDFIMKYDIGFSGEDVGIYLGTGYSF